MFCLRYVLSSGGLLRLHTFLNPCFQTHEMRNEVTSKQADKEGERGLSVHCLRYDILHAHLLEEVCMTVVATALVDIQTSSQDVPTLPAWFAESNPTRYPTFRQSLW